MEYLRCTVQADYAAAEAMRVLKIRQQTLYAFVGRGWIRSVPQPGSLLRPRAEFVTPTRQP